MSTAVVYFRQATDDHRKETIWSALLATLAAGTILIVIAALFSEFISYGLTGSPKYANLVLLFSISMAFQITAYPLIGNLQFRGKPFKYTTAFSGTGVIGIVAALLLVIFTDRGISSWVEGILFGSATMFVLAAAFNHDLINTRFNLTVLLDQIKLGFPVIPSLLFLFVLQSAGTYLLQHSEHGIEAVGIYGIGFNLGLAMSLLVTGFITAWTPFFQTYALRPTEAPGIFARVHLLYTVILGGVTILFFVAARPVVLLLTEPAYHEAYRVVGVLAAAQFLVGTWSLLVPGIYFSGRTYIQSVIQGIAAVTTVGITAILIPIIDIEGAALAMLIGTLLMCLILARHNKATDYVATRYSLRSVYLCLLVVGAAGSIQRILDETLTPLQAMAGSIVIIIAYCGFATIFLPPINNARSLFNTLIRHDHKR